MRTPVLIALMLLVPLPASTEEPELKVQARILRLPKNDRCVDNEVRVVVRYRVEKVLSGKIPDDEPLLVVHRCPEVPRGPSRFGRGNAPRMRPGHRHILTLQPTQPSKRVIDPFEELKAPRYKAVRTDKGPEDPRIMVIVTGGAGTRHKVNFDAESVIVGRAPDADVYLGDRSLVGPRQLRLQRTGDVITVHNLDLGYVVLLNGMPLTQPTKITCKDRITVGLYTIRAALFLSVKDED